MRAKSRTLESPGGGESRSTDLTRPPRRWFRQDGGTIYGLGRVAERGEAVVVGQPSQRLLFELTRPLGGDAELLAGVAEAQRGCAAEAVAKLEYLALALVKNAQRRLDLAGHRLVDRLLLRTGDLACHQVSEGRLRAIADRLVEARDDVGQRPDVCDLLGLQLDRFGQLLDRGLAAQTDREITLGASNLALALTDVRRKPDRTAGVGQTALDRLTDPERCVSRELEALAPVELLGGTDEPHDPLLDEVVERQTLPAVAAGHVDHEPQVRSDHPILRVEIAALDALRELDLLCGCEQRILRGLLEEELQRLQVAGQLLLLGIGGRVMQALDLSALRLAGLHAAAESVLLLSVAVRLYPFLLISGWFIRHESHKALLMVRPVKRAVVTRAPHLC